MFPGSFSEIRDAASLADGFLRPGSLCYAVTAGSVGQQVGLFTHSVEWVKDPDPTQDHIVLSEQFITCKKL